MTYFTGIDVSLRSVSICVVDDRGEVYREAKVDAHVDVIIDWLRPPRACAAGQSQGNPGGVR